VYHGVSVGISYPLNVALAIPDQLDLLSDVHDLGLRILDFVVEGREIIKSWVLESESLFWCGSRKHEVLWVNEGRVADFETLGLRIVVGRRTL
jgi:hypothetical protein